MFRLPNVLESIKCAPSFIKPSLDVFLLLSVLINTSQICELVNCSNGFSMDFNLSCRNVDVYDFGFAFADVETCFLCVHTEVI